LANLFKECICLINIWIAELGKGRKKRGNIIENQKHGIELAETMGAVSIVNRIGYSKIKEKNQNIP